MKVLLINQPWICNETEYGLRAGLRLAQRRRRDRALPYYPFPFALAHATSYLRGKGIDARLRDSIALEESREQALAYIRQEGFGLVVLDTATASIAVDMEFCDSIKSMSPGTTVCLSGQHATAMPQEVMRNSLADHVLIGEYEKALLNLVTAVMSGQPTSHVKGTMSRCNGSLIDNGREVPINLDELPPPYRDPALFRKYNEPSARYFPNATVMTSRGCSFKCTFCVEAILNYGKDSGFRYRSMGKVRTEILALAQEGAREIVFDDTFFTKKHAEELSDMFASLPIRLHWSGWIDRAMPEETLRKMKQSGCVGVKFAVETFDESIGKAAKKRVSRSVVEALTERCRKVGLLTHASYIFGLPGETRQSLDHTFSVAMALNTTTFQFAIATPLPGTEFYDQAVANGWLATSDWSRFEGQGSSVLRYDDLTNDDLVEAMSRARQAKMRKLLGNPAALLIYLAKTIRMMGFRAFVFEVLQKVRFFLQPLQSTR